MAAGLSWHAGEKRAIETLYATTLPDLDSHLQSFSQWRNTTLLINYWATWCEPCREEVPALIRIQTRYSSKNIQIVGIALDSPDRVRGFAKSFGINYPLFIGGTGMIDLMHAQGNAVGALPFTVVVAPGGATTQVHLGALSEQEAESLIARTQAGSGS
jgi:thiol-disulfide isomerase/thioredoxin